MVKIIQKKKLKLKFYKKAQLDVDLLIAYIIFIVAIVFIVRYIISLTTPFSSAINFQIKEKERIALRNILSLNKISIDRFNQLCNVKAEFKNISANLKIVGIPLPGLDTGFDVKDTNGSILIRRNKTNLIIEAGGKKCLSGNLILTFPNDVAINQTLLNTSRKALDFATGYSSYVGIPSSSSLESFFSTQQLSIEFWIKIHDVSPSQYVIIEKDLLNGFAIYLDSIFYSPPAFIFTIHGDERIIHQMPVELERWYFFTFTIGTNGTKMYIDGNLVDSSPLTTVSSTNAPLSIGALYGGSFGITATIDEVRIYNRTLSASEIKNHYNGCFSIPESGLVGLWHFDEGSGSIAYDSSGNGNNGTLYGSSPFPVWLNRTWQISQQQDAYKNNILNISIKSEDNTYTKYEISTTFNDNTIIQIEPSNFTNADIYVGNTKLEYKCGTESLGPYSYNELFTNFENNGTSFLSLLTTKIWW
jgi:hypothetical protein